MQGITVHGVDRPNLDDLAQVHDQHPVCDVVNDVEVVRDEDVGQIECVLQVEEERENLRLDGFVKGGDRLVEDQQPRLQGERTSDVDPLALATGELVGISAAETGGVEADAVQKLTGSFARLLAGGAVDGGAEGNGVLDRKTRIE